MNCYKLSFAAFVSLALLTSPASAQSVDYVSVSVGYYDVLDGDASAVDFRAEYRPAIPVMIEELKPWAGLEVNTDFSAWAGGGLLYDYAVDERWTVTPSFGAGLYAQGSSDLDLSKTVQFRSQLEASYGFDTGQRAGVAISHMSNGGLSDTNPGVEVLSLYWHVPY